MTDRSKYDRRAFLTLTGAVVVGLAGCTGDDQEFEEGNGDDDDTDTATTTEEETGELVLVEHDLVIEDEGEITEQVYIEGVVRNETGERVDYVEVEARLYNDDGQQINTAFTNTTDLDPGVEWAFEILVLEDAADVDSYDIAVSDSAF